MYTTSQGTLKCMTTQLAQAITLVEEFIADWQDDALPTPVLARKWEMSDGTARVLGRRLSLGPRRRGPRRKPGQKQAPWSSPRALTNGEWVNDAGVMRWRSAPGLDPTARAIAAIGRKGQAGD